MTLFSAEGLIRASAGRGIDDVHHTKKAVHHALLRWYRTQGGVPRVGTDDAGLIVDRRLWEMRAPGRTCLSALGASRHLGDDAVNDSKGSGTIMRVAPAALMVPRGQVRRIAIETSALTHGHRTGQLAAAAWAEMLAEVADGAGLEDTAKEMAKIYAGMEGGDETVAAIDAALDAPRDGYPERIEKTLGGGWIAEEALSIALYACLAGTCLDSCLRIAVTHSGDSDSTGTMAGNMLGLIYPETVLGRLVLRPINT